MTTVSEIKSQMRREVFDSLSLWRTNKRVSLWQAALLAVGKNPANFTKDDSSLREIAGYTEILSALVDAVEDHSLNEDPREGIKDLTEIKVLLTEVDRLLCDRGLQSIFFDGTISGDTNSNVADYLTPQNLCYAPKLAAAVKAWMAVVGAGEYKTKKTPKQLIEEWLIENAKDFGLVKKNGSLNKQAISDIAKVANWAPEGGAGKTGAPTKPTSKQR